MSRIGETRCGTVTGNSAHLTRGEKACEACKAAKAEYDKRRLSAPELRRLSRLTARAQSRAYSLLASRHPAEYRVYYQEAKADLLREAERVESEAS